MLPKLEQLAQAGCAIADALPRFLNDEAFMLDCIEAVLDDASFEALGEALEKGDAKAAFDAAHSLKGVAANTGLTPLVSAVSALVEPLRAGTCTGLESAYHHLLLERNRLKTASEN